MAFKMKYGKGRSSFPYKTPLNKKHDDDVLSKEIKDTRELSPQFQEKSRRGGIGPEESSEVIAKKEKDFLEGVDRAREEFLMRPSNTTGVATEPSPEADRAMELAKEYDEAYRYKKEPGKRSFMKKNGDPNAPELKVGQGRTRSGDKYETWMGDDMGWVGDSEHTADASKKLMMERIQRNKEAEEKYKDDPRALEEWQNKTSLADSYWDADQVAARSKNR